MKISINNIANHNCCTMLQRPTKSVIEIHSRTLIEDLEDFRDSLPTVASLVGLLFFVCEWVSRSVVLVCMSNLSGWAIEWPISTLGTSYKGTYIRAGSGWTNEHYWVFYINIDKYECIYKVIHQMVELHVLSIGIIVLTKHMLIPTIKSVIVVTSNLIESWLWPTTRNNKSN